MYGWAWPKVGGNPDELVSGRGKHKVVRGNLRVGIGKLKVGVAGRCDGA